MTESEFHGLLAEAYNKIKELYAEIDMLERANIKFFDENTILRGRAGAAEARLKLLEKKDD